MAENELTKAEKKALHVEVVRQMLTLATSGFGLVAALAWNNLIQEFVGAYFKKGEGMVSLFIYAVIVTALAVIVTMQLSRLLQSLEKR